MAKNNKIIEEVDNVNRPSHYISNSGIESIDVIEAFDLGFNLGNSVKYILRSGKKGGSREKEIEDLKKSIWYLKREIVNLKK